MNRTLVFTLIFASFLAGASVAAANDLPKSIKLKLGQVASSFQSGNSGAVIELGGRVIQQLEEAELKTANDLLKLQNLPTLQEMLVDSRIDLSRPEVTAKVPLPGNKELLFLSEEIIRRGNEIELEYREHPVGTGSIASPAKYADYETYFWDLHVFRNRLTNAISTTGQVGSIIQTRKNRLKSLKLSDERKSLIQYDFSDRASELEKVLADLEEREAFLRIFRIEDTISNIKIGNSEKDKFTFAYNMESDVLFLKSFFKRFAGHAFVREDLNDQSLLESVSNEALETREKFADKIKKGKLLFVGMHWWFRGRYGSGPIANGLLKAPGADVSEEKLFPLAMPTAAPKPLDPYENNYRIPHYERRHHYTWQIQQESIHTYQRPPLSQTTKTKTDTPEGAPKYKKFY